MSIQHNGSDGSVTNYHIAHQYPLRQQNIQDVHGRLILPITQCANLVHLLQLNCQPNGET